MNVWQTVFYLGFFATAAWAVVWGGLLLGRLLRPHRPVRQKLEPYECGEPAVGSADIRFDVRFYVVALVFIVFEVEAAFFFPWATVFGKVVRGQTGELPSAFTSSDAKSASIPGHSLSVARADLTGTTVDKTSGELAAGSDRNRLRTIQRDFALAALADIAVFFGVLLVGFAYIWSRGDLNWIMRFRKESTNVISGEAARE